MVDALVQEGLLTHDQAVRVRAKVDAAAEEETPASRIALSDAVKKLTFYGDGRLRFENIDQHNHYAAISLNDRERYRLRIGADYTYSDHFKAGFELESGTTDDSANQTFGGMFTKASINVGKIYLRYDPTDWLTAYAGKFTNPWYTTTDMVYSFDLNPEGGAEIFTFQPTDNLTVGFNAVQYLYIDANEGSTLANVSNERRADHRQPDSGDVEDHQGRDAEGRTGLHLLHRRREHELRYGRAGEFHHQRHDGDRLCRDGQFLHRPGIPEPARGG